jgi:3-methyladenine DNA glycosylase AlkC
MAIKATPSFSLKDQLFNQQKVQLIAGEITAVYPEFQTKQFIKMVVTRLPALELLERLYWIRDCLRAFLPCDYRVATKILLASLPPVCDPALSDNDFGDFIYGPYGAFVAEYGCTRKDLQFSLNALKEMTKRFSVEFPIRSFLNTFPEETLTALQKMTTDKHYHVRRLASEGTRPKLPWAKNVTIDYKAPLLILDALYADSTRFVTRSVANHMNDISKIDPAFVVHTLKRWKKAGTQDQKEIDYIIRHSLRTLEKRGDTAALQLLGYGSGEVKLQHFQVLTPTVAVGAFLEFSFEIVSIGKQIQKLLVDYNLYFQKANGTLSAKTFKITKTSIKPGETISFTKRQLLRPMTTRILHTGQHKLALQINGQLQSEIAFWLEDVSS